MSILDNKNRIGNFTSSENHRLMGLGKRPMTAAELASRPKSGVGSSVKTIEDPSILNDAAFEYIEEKNMERRLGRSLSTETNARPLTWGHVCERQAFETLGTDYKLCSDVTLDHPEIAFWRGSPDALKFDEGGTVGEIKCPMTMKSFCQLVDPLYHGFSGTEAMNAIRNGWKDKSGLNHKPHKDAEKYYWQIVSNAILSGSKYGELIVYCPYESELEALREIVNNWDGNQNPLAWINFSENSELPYLLDDGFYKNLNIIRFEIPIEDRILMKVKIEMAGKMLITC